MRLLISLNQRKLDLILFPAIYMFSASLKHFVIACQYHLNVFCLDTSTIMLILHSMQRRPFNSIHLCVISFVVRVTSICTAMVRLSNLFIDHRFPHLRVHRKRYTVNHARMQMHIHEATVNVSVIYHRQ